ncbi:MAG TPA: hypothetical protein VMV68_01970 [Spirochaetia bacterium]|nr:hypothetical protein [Spirochaetia bacterium]
MKTNLYRGFARRIFAGIIAFCALSLALPAAAHSLGLSPVPSIGATVRGGALFTMPDASFLADFSFPLAAGRIEILPEAGVSYFFLPMTEVGGPLFIPLGVEIRFPTSGLALSVLHEFSYSAPLSVGIVNLGVTGFLSPVDGPRARLRIGARLGMGIVWSTSAAPLYLVTAETFVGFDVRTKRLPVPQK